MSIQFRRIAFDRRSPPFTLFALLVAAAAVALVPVCGRAASTPWHETLLYSFGGLVDGALPAFGLVADRSGNLYGTTGYGGCAHACYGTVFELSPPAPGQTRWKHTVLHAFPPIGGPDGAFPEAGLIVDARGDLYGTTLYGGYLGGACSGGCGIVFRLSRPCRGRAQWRETVLHAFTYADGEHPSGTLIADAHRDLYGTTQRGGYADLGVVFRLTPPAAGRTGWTATVLHAFGPPPDGDVPLSATAGPGGTIYGTTAGGGADGAAGTVFVLAPRAGPNWPITILHSFTGGADGSNPTDLITDARGDLFGTTINGGIPGGGTAFEIAPPLPVSGAWAYRLLFAFSNASHNGVFPLAGVVADANGALYGTTSAGAPHGMGSVYVLTPPPPGQTAWMQSAVHLFGLIAGDGRQPEGRLIFDRRGNLYGTTFMGGAHDDGTVFELSRP